MAGCDQNLISRLGLGPLRRLQHPGKPGLGRVNPNWICHIFALEVYRSNQTPSLDRRVGIFGAFGRIDILGQVAQGNDRAALIVQVFHVRSEIVWLGIDPRVIESRHSVEVQDGNLPICRLLNGPDKIFKIPVRT